jgi:hypothetical protein
VVLKRAPFREAAGSARRRAREGAVDVDLGWDGAHHVEHVPACSPAEVCPPL